MAFIIEGGIKKIIKSSLEFHIRLEISGADLVIEDLDIDIELLQSRNSEPNKSTITIWNISDDTFKKLLDTQAVDVYCWHGEDEPQLIFRGYTKSDYIVNMKAVAGRINPSKGFLASTVKQDNKGQFDIPTVIELVDSRINYLAAKINKSYTSEISSKALISDCIEAMGVGIGSISKNLQEKVYKYGYKLLGRPHIVLKQILDSLGARFFVTNGFINIYVGNEENNDEYAVVLNDTNSAQPDRRSDDELIIGTQLVQFLKANDWVKLDFKEITGLERIETIHTKANNYGTAGTSEIIIKLPVEKIKKKKAKRGS